MKRLFRSKVTNKGILAWVSIINATKRTLTLVGVLALLWSYVPWQQIQAEVLDDDPISAEVNSNTSSKPDYPTTTDEDFDPSLIEIDSEVVSERTENSKTFKKTDGTYEISVYDNVIHYQENDEFKDINNSLFDNGTELENISNKFKIKFPKKLSESKQIKVSMDGYDIDWNILNITSSDATYDNNDNTSNNIKELTNISQSILYMNIQQNVDIEYVISGSKIKENIILNEFIPNFSMSFEYKVKGLTLTQNIDGDYVFVNDENNVIFTIEDLYMYDSNYEYSSNVQLDFVQVKDKEYILTLTPDNEWLSSASYPVVIDPTISSIGYSSGFATDPTNAVYTSVDSMYPDLPFIYDDYMLLRSEDDIPSNNTEAYGLLKFDIPTGIQDNIIVSTKINLKVFGIGANAQVLTLQKNNGDFDDDTVWNPASPDAKPTHDDSYLDFCSLQYVNGQNGDYYFCSLDVTNYYLDLQTDGGDNYGFSLKNIGSSDQLLQVGTSNNSSYLPYIEFGYIKTEGIKHYWTYNSLDTGSAGVAYVSDFTGEMTIQRQDVAFTNERQSLGLSYTYNSNDNEIDYGYGAGWLTNYNYIMNLNTKVFTEPSGNEVQYVESTCTDEFTDDPYVEYTCYYSEDGSGNILVKKVTDISTTYTLNTPNNLEYRFNSSGNIQYIYDENTSLFTRVYYSNSDLYKIDYIKDDYGNRINFDYTSTSDYDYKVSLELLKSDGSTYNSIEEVYYDFSYDSSISEYILSEVEYYANYDSADTFEIYSGATYGYTTSIITKMTEHFNKDNIDIYGMRTSFILDSMGLVDEVTISNVQSSSTESIVGTLIYDRDIYSTKITSSDGSYIEYNFDYYGHTIQTLNNYGIVNSTKYATNINFYMANKVVTQSVPYNTIVNPIINNNFEYANSVWHLDPLSDSGSSFSYSTSQSLIGDQSGNIYNDGTGEAILKQTDIYLDTDTYTLSGYYKTELGVSGKVVVSGDASGDYELVLQSNESWTKFDLQFKVTEENTNISIKFINNSNGNLYIDNIQTVVGFTDSRMNALENSHFENFSMNSWTSNYSSKVNQTVHTEYLNTPMEDHIGETGLKLTGDISTITTVKTYVYDLPNYENATTNIFVGSWAQGDVTPSTSFGLMIKCYDNNDNSILIQTGDNTYSYTQEVNFESYNKSWQFWLESVELPTNTDYVEVMLFVDGPGEVVFDNVQVYFEGQEISFGYDNGMLTDKYISETEYYTYSYVDGKINSIHHFTNTMVPSDPNFLENWEEDITYIGFEGHTLSDIEVDNVKIANTTNSYGQTTNVTVGDGAVSYSTQTYFNTLGSQYISEMVNEHSISTYSDYDELTGLLSSVEDANGNEYDYTYTNTGQIKTVTNSSYCNSQAVCSKVTYSYDIENRLETITLSSGQIYTLSYDSQDRIENVSVGNTNLISYTYVDEGGYISGRTNTKTYANQDSYQYTYDDNDNLEYVKFKDTSESTYSNLFGYKYDQMGRVAIINYYESGSIISSESYTYDSSGNLIKVSDSNGNSISYGYDNSGNLSSYSFDVNDTEHEVNYFYNKILGDYDSSDTFVSSSYDKTMYDTINNISVLRQYNYVQEALYRLDNVQTSFNGNSITKNTTYKLNTDRITSYTYSVNKSGNPTIYYYQTYSYDDLGNIIDINFYGNDLPLQHMHYEYDENNQIIIEDVMNEAVDCSTLQDTCYSRIYDYDLHGNILETRTYKYGERDITTVPDDYITGSNVVVTSTNCNLNLINEISLNATLPNCSFTYYEDFTFPPVPVSLTTSLGSNFPRDKAGYFLQEYTATGRGYSVQIGVVFKVGNPPAPGPNTPLEKITYSYNDNLWKDQLSSYTVLDDGVTKTSNITYDNQGNPTYITNFKYEDAIYDFAELSWDGRILKRIHVSDTPSKNLLDPDALLVGDYIMETSENIEVEGNTYYTITIPNEYFLGRDIEMYIYGVDSYVSGYVEYLSNCTVSSSSVSCTFLTDENESDIYIEIAAEYLGYYFADQGMYGFQLEEGQTATSYQAYFPYDEHTITYAHNDAGIRTSKTIDGVTTTYTLSGDMVIHETDGTYELSFTYDVDGTLISFYYDSDITIKGDGDEYFYITDIQGNIIQIVDENGDVVVKYIYDAWGNILDINDTSSKNIGTINPYTYRAYRYDKELDYYYLQSRYYNPQIGRFINADGLLGEQGNILGHNMYAYTQNNPVMFSDISGKFPVAILITSVIIGLVAAGFELGMQYSEWKNSGSDGDFWNQVDWFAVGIEGGSAAIFTALTLISLGSATAASSSWYMYSRLGLTASTQILRGVNEGASVWQITKSTAISMAFTFAFVRIGARPMSSSILDGLSPFVQADILSGMQIMRQTGMYASRYFSKQETWDEINSVLELDYEN